MASGFSTKASVYATALLATLSGVCGLLPSRSAQAGAGLRSDADNEVKLGPPSRLPLLGPRYAPITIDLFLPFGHKVAQPNLSLLLRLFRDSSDVRLLFHPVLGNEVTERGAEAIFSSWQHESEQQNGAEHCFAFAENLVGHPEYLLATAEADAQLVEAARAAELDTRPLLRELRRRAFRAMVNEIWQSERNDVRTPPEIWVNGRRLRGSLSEAQVREELERQRARAYHALRTGTPLTQLYELLVQKERNETPSPFLYGVGRQLLPAFGSSLGLHSPFGPSIGASGSSSAVMSRVLGGSTFTLPGPGFAASSSWRGSSPMRIDLAGSPLRGPEVSPVTLTIIGSLDTYATYLLVRATHEVWQKRSDTVRLVFQHAPTSDGSRKVAQLLGQLGLLDPEGFWRAFDGIRELMLRRYMLRYNDITDLLRRQHVDVSRLEQMIRDPREGEAVRALLERDLEQAQRLGLSSTPVLLLNGRPLPGQPMAEPLSRRVDGELRRGLLSRLPHP